MTTRYSIGFIVSFVILGTGNLGLAYEIAEVNNPGMLTGEIRFVGKVPAPRTFVVEKNPEVCGEQRTLTKVSVQNGKLKGTIVMLEGISKGKPFEEKSFKASAPDKGEFYYHAGEKLALDVRTNNCNFGPYTGVLARNEPIRFSNHDSIKHTLHTYVRRGTKATVLKTVHNRGIQPADTIEQTFTEKKLPRPGVVAVTCDRHDFMENWLYVVDSPYFSISDENGQFSIEGIPPGQYDLVAWHPVLGSQHQEVTVTPQGTLNVHFQFVKK